MTTHSGDLVSGPGSPGPFPSAPRVVGWMIDEDMCEACPGSWGTGWTIFLELPNGDIQRIWACVTHRRYSTS